MAVRSSNTKIVIILLFTLPCLLLIVSCSNKKNIDLNSRLTSQEQQINLTEQQLSNANRALDYERNIAARLEAELKSCNATKSSLQTERNELVMQMNNLDAVDKKVLLKEIEFLRKEILTREEAAYYKGMNKFMDGLGIKIDSFSKNVSFWTDKHYVTINISVEGDNETRSIFEQTFQTAEKERADLIHARDFITDSMSIVSGLFPFALSGVK